MHPEIEQDHPGICPKCGMALEPMMPSLDDDNPELKDFSRRFWWTLPFTIVVTGLAMFGPQLGWFDITAQTWIELVLSWSSEEHTSELQSRGQLVCRLLLDKEKTR